MKQEATTEIFSYVAADAKLVDAAKFPNFVTFPLAVTERYKDRNQNEVENTTWYDVASSKEKLSEMLLKYATKGRPVYVSGVPKLVTYTSNNGETKAKIQISLEKIKFLDSANKDEQSMQTNAATVTKSMHHAMDFDDEVPF